MFSNIYKGKRVFVTGHTGFKGSWLVTWLLKLGATVGGYSKGLPSNPSMFDKLGLEEDIEHFVGDVRDQETFRKALESFKPDVVFHLAANAIVKDCIADPVEAFETNTIGTVNLLNIVKSNPSIKACLLITSDKCYENVEWAYGYREIDRLGGKDPYSASKACAEIAISSFMRTYFKNQDQTMIASARAGNVIGGGDWANHRLIPDCIRSWSKGDEVVIRSPDATRPWQHVLEPLSGYLRIGQSLLEGSKCHLESFNIGPASELNATVLDLLVEMKKHWESSKWSVERSENSHEAGLLKLSCDKALSYLNWQPTLSFEETIEFTINWYKHFYETSESIKEITDSQLSAYCEAASRSKKEWIS